MHSYLDEAEGRQASGAGGENPAARNMLTSEALAVLLGGGKDQADEGQKILMAVRQKQVKEYFQQLETQSGHQLSTKRVYVASDDPKVLSECRNKFPDYEFLGDLSIAKSAAVSSRYNLNSLRGIIADIHMLSLSDFMVCTFSSQVCRIAYEIQQQRYITDKLCRF